MRNVKTIILITMVICMFILTGCDAKEYIDDTKDEIEYYYDNYNDEDFDDIIDTVHPALLDIMSEEDFINFFTARMYYYGKVDEYEIVSTNISYENGLTYVELGVDTEYESGKTFNEIFEYVYEDKNEGYMIAIDVPTE